MSAKPTSEAGTRDFNPPTVAGNGPWGSGGGYGQPGSGYPMQGQSQTGPGGGPGTGAATPQVIDA